MSCCKIDQQIAFEELCAKLKPLFRTGRGPDGHRDDVDEGVAAAAQYFLGQCMLWSEREGPSYVLESPIAAWPCSAFWEEAHGAIDLVDAATPSLVDGHLMKAAHGILRGA